MSFFIWVFVQPPSGYLSIRSKVPFLEHINALSFPLCLPPFSGNPAFLNSHFPNTFIYAQWFSPVRDNGLYKRSSKNEHISIYFVTSFCKSKEPKYRACFNKGERKKGKQNWETKLVVCKISEIAFHYTDHLLLSSQILIKT